MPIPMQTFWEDIARPEGVMRAYVARPAAPPQGAVLVLQEIFGVNAHIQSIAERLAQAGFLALAPDMFWRVRPGFTAGYTPAEFEQCRALIWPLPLPQVLEDIGAALAHLAQHPAAEHKPCAVLGFCWGGLMTVLSAAKFQPAAVVGFYTSRIGEHLETLAQVRSPLMLHYGALDAHIPPDWVAGVRQTLHTHPQAQVFVYPEAGHGFNCDARESYHAPSAQLAWERTLGFLRAHGVGG